MLRPATYIRHANPMQVLTDDPMMPQKKVNYKLSEPPQAQYFRATTFTCLSRVTPFIQFSNSVQ